MFASKRITGAAVGAALLATTAACVTDPETGQRRVDQRVIGGVLGTAGGYLLGDLLGGRRDRTEKIVGAGIGAIAGAAVGDYMERQRRELERRTAGTGVIVEQQGDELLLTAPAGITFPVNSAVIQPQFRATLDQVAQTMNAYPSTLIDVYGHTDPSGGDRINIPLSQQRAQAVASYLISRAVNPARIMTQGFGSSRPVADNSTEAGRAQNRRVEIRIAPATRG
ncbi:MAG TPA: OmpA family protein [Allosphingosinicella sp.]|nr:OmpA family protein [Allosphingosinicella sp.]